MAKGVVEVRGQDVEVREDTAKAFRGIHWAIISIIAFVVITAVLFFAGVFTTAVKPGTSSPTVTDRPAQ